MAVYKGMIIANDGNRKYSKDCQSTENMFLTLWHYLGNARRKWFSFFTFTGWILFCSIQVSACSSHEGLCLCLNCTSHARYVIFWSLINPWMSIILTKPFTLHLCSPPTIFIPSHPSPLRGKSDPSTAKVHFFQLFSQQSFSPSIHKHIYKCSQDAALIFSTLLEKFAKNATKVNHLSFILK